MEQRDGPRHNLKVDPSYTFEGVLRSVKVNSFADSYTLNTTWQRSYKDMTDVELNAIIRHGPSSGIDSAPAITELNRRRGQYSPTPPEQQEG